ncbi:hypothetical protein [Methanococcoides methylutens]|nr:hypothetical protein [Methanococcoides methylutens]
MIASDNAIFTESNIEVAEKKKRMPADRAGIKDLIEISDLE